MSLELFLDSIKSDETRKHYSCYLDKFLDYSGNNLTENKVIEFILQLKKEGKSFTAIQNYLAPIKLYYSINDIALNIKKIDRFLPEQKRKRKDRAYTHEEISKLLSIADDRMKVVILLMASSGIRIGAIPDLRLEHLEKTQMSIYRIAIYDKTTSEYLTFITPECQKAIDNYIDMRSRYGEKINDNSLLIREQFNTRIINAKPKKVNTDLLHYKLYDLIRRAGIDRNDIAIAHAFRKFFTTQLINSNVKSEIREMLLGHKIGLASCYYRPSEGDMYLEYEKAIDSLTINEENRLRKKNTDLQKKYERLDHVLERIDIMEKKLGINQVAS